MDTKLLKQKILDLAIHGKLVPQNSTDEPASKLLEKVRIERAKLIFEKKIKLDKNESYIYQADDGKYYEKFACGIEVNITEEIPFKIPSSWSWCRLGEVVDILDSLRKPITKSDRIAGQYPYYGATCIQDYVNDYIFNEDLLLLGEDGAKWGAGETSSFCISGKTWVNNHAHVLRARQSIELIYLNLVLNCFDLTQYITGTTVPKLNQQKMISILIPLPPFTEQKRIVEKIEEIFSYINIIENEKVDLGNLIKQAKSKVLDLAIHGKLVPQDFTDEPAERLLEKVRAEKQAKIEAGEIKRDKNESYIYKNASDNCYYEKFACGREINITEEIPFEIPSNWSWCRLVNIIDFNLGKTPARDKSIYWQNDFPWVSISDMVENGVIRTTKERVSNYAMENVFKGRFSKKGTLIMSFKLTVGRVSILGMDAVHNEAIISIYPKYDENNSMQKYLFNMLPYITDSVDKKEAIKGKTLNKESISNILIPLPPLAEQKRIVEKIEEIFSYLDKITLNLV